MWGANLGYTEIAWYFFFCGVVVFVVLCFFVLCFFVVFSSFFGFLLFCVVGCGSLLCRLGWWVCLWAVVLGSVCH